MTSKASEMTFKVANIRHRNTRYNHGYEQKN